MKNWIKKLFKRRNNQSSKPINIHSITCGERDENGFADTYVNGEKTNVKILVWERGEVEKLHKISEKIHKQNNNK